MGSRSSRVKSIPHFVGVGRRVTRDNARDSRCVSIGYLSMSSSTVFGLQGRWLCVHRCLLRTVVTGWVAALPSGDNPPARAGVNPTAWTGANPAAPAGSLWLLGSASIR
ncbi:hypothetical protein GCM10022224_079590 [Nonomuraea antimicrobica]|uniref:Uncharacterized protein n=1 Tax=Nonomuraea antimicrobica TaxID=561173 RepID=A0ABP7DAN7_9ACTN